MAGMAGMGPDADERLSSSWGARIGHRAKPMKESASAAKAATRTAFSSRKRASFPIESTRLCMPVISQKGFATLSGANYGDRRS